jgi:hypothetical protein
MTRSSARPHARFVTLAALLALALGLLGCGGGDDDASNGDGESSAFPPNVTTDDDIAAQEEGSPERALLEWWQAFQFQDVATVEGLTSEDVLDAIGEKDLANLVKTRGQGLQGIEVLSASESGDTASVRIGLLQFTPEEEGGPPPTEPTSSQPSTIAMQSDGGEWLFDELAYLEPMIESLEAAEQAAKEGSAEQQPGDQ